MKPFDLQEALNGALVQLRNGQKAYVVGLSKVGAEDGNSYIVGEYERNLCNWSKDGKYWLKSESELDIVGMYEEPKLTSEQVLEKAYNEDLLVLCDGNPDLPLKIIAKTKDGKFVMQPEDDTIQPWLANLTMEWLFAKDLDPKFDTITNTIALPKPFKPKDGESYYYICGRAIECMRKYAEVSHFDSLSAQNGQCFRTREDAQKWLDFMKSMME